MTKNGATSPPGQVHANQADVIDWQPGQSGEPEPGNVLAYERVLPGIRLARPPISRAFAVIIFFAFTWPFILTIPVAFGKMFLTMIAIAGTVAGGITATVALVIRMAIVKPSGAPTTCGSLLSRRRWTICFIAIAALILLHLSGVLFRITFAMHYPLFKKALADVSGMGPSARAPHGRIGLFPVDTIHRGRDGEVGFGMGGDGITYDPTPATTEWFFCPPDDGGPIFGNWRWTESD